MMIMSTLRKCLLTKVHLILPNTALEYNWSQSQQNNGLETQFLLRNAF